MSPYIENLRQIERLFPKRWRDKAVYVAIFIQDMGRCDLFKHAYSMAYITLLSLIPSLAAVFALMSLFSPVVGEGSELLDQVRSWVLSNLAAASSEQVLIYMENFLANLDLKKIGLTGFAGMIVTLIMLIRQIELALNRIFMVRKGRNLLLRFVYFWTFITLGTFLLGLSIGIVSGFNLESLIGRDQDFDTSILGQIFPIFATFIFFSFMYKVVPNTRVASKPALIGALIATLLFTIVASFYGVYTSSFTNYQAVYGALAALPAFLLWMYLLWVITLLGALVAWRLQEGFDIDQGMDEANFEKTPADSFRNCFVRYTLPAIILTFIYRRHSEAQGVGISLERLHQELDVPPDWIDDSCTFLKIKKLAVSQGSEYFPSYPGSHMNLRKAYGLLNEGIHLWLDETERDPTHPALIFEKILQRCESALPDEPFDPIHPH